MNYLEIGRKIRSIRETELKLTREEFAEKIGSSVDTVRRLENATRKVTNIEIYKNISSITGYSIEELLGGDNEMNHKTLKKINHLLIILSDKELEYVYNYLNEFIKFLRREGNYYSNE